MRRLAIASIVLFASTARSSAAQRADSLSLSIQDAVNRAIRVGDEARAAAVQIEIADAQVTIARAAGLPQLRLTGSQSHVSESARAQAVGAIFNQPNTYTANANFSQALFQGGRIMAGARAASAIRSAARLDAEETKAQVALDVQRAYLQVLFAKRLAEIQDAGLSLAAERVRQAEQFEAAGRAARYDVLRARVQQANLEPVVIEARSDVELSMLNLKRLANIPSSQPLKLTSSIDTMAVREIAGRVASAPALGDRPALKSAEALVQARKAGVRVARADLLPTIALNGVIGGQAFPLSGLPNGRGRLDVVPCPAASAADRVCTQQNGGWFGDKSFGLSMSWPIFDGLRAKGAIDLAQANARLAELQLAQKRESVESEIGAARAELDRAQSLFAARRTNAQEADEAFRLATLRYSRGLGTQLEVSDAQLALTTAQTNEARSIFDLYLAAATLARALGQPVPLPDRQWNPATSNKNR
ncbi:MAG: TolC family protein [Gemmatimonadaceae bacterium]|nr:TolC family protein [Gemmatimonadaceae bacterium]